MHYNVAGGLDYEGVLNIYCLLFGKLILITITQILVWLVGISKCINLVINCYQNIYWSALCFMMQKESMANCALCISITLLV